MKALGVPEELDGRMKKSFNDVAQFAATFYGYTYKTPREWHDFLDNQLPYDYSNEFFKEFFPSEWCQETNDQKEYETFEPSRPPKLLSWDDTSADWQVEGTVTLRSDLAYDGKLISKEHKVLTISVAYDRDGSEAVYMVKETGK